MLVVNASNIEGDFAWIASLSAAGRRDARESCRTTSRCSPCRGRARWRSCSRSRRRRSRRSSTTASRTVRSPAGRRSSRAPATPARTASRSSSRRRTRCELWRRALRRRRIGRARAGGARSPRHAAPRGRHGALRPRDRPRDDALGRPARLDGQAREGRFRRPRRAGRRAGARREPPPGRLRGRGARHRAPGLRDHERWAAGGRRHQRNLEPHLREGARHGLRAGRAGARSGTGVEIDVRGKLLQARVTALPFYKRSR